MSHSPLKNVPSANFQTVVNWQMGHFSVVSLAFVYIFWLNLINILIFPIYYTYIYLNINNLSEKELKSPETQIETQTKF